MIWRDFAHFAPLFSPLPVAGGHLHTVFAHSEPIAEQFPKLVFIQLMGSPQEGTNIEPQSNNWVSHIPKNAPNIGILQVPERPEQQDLRWQRTANPWQIQKNEKQPVCKVQLRKALVLHWDASPRRQSHCKVLLGEGRRVNCL